MFQNPIQDPAFSSYLSCLLRFSVAVTVSQTCLCLWSPWQLWVVLVREFVDCLSVWVCLIFLLSSFLGYTAVWVLRGGPQWWHVILVSTKGPAISRTCHSWCWPWGPCRDGIKYGVIYKSRGSGGAQGPEWALSCGPLPALMSWTLVSVLPFVLVLSSHVRGRLSIPSQAPTPVSATCPPPCSCYLHEAHHHQHPAWAVCLPGGCLLPGGQALEGEGCASYTVSSAPVTVSGT